MIRYSGALLLMTMACTAVPPDEEAPREVGASGHVCSTEGLASLVGQPATSELGADALQRSGARTLRWIRPGDAVTMDYREDRLNIHLDDENRVERFQCG
jgi:Peptidase inhibitor I78 family